MRDPRNPFRLRRAESIDRDAAFLSLFEPGILEVLPSDRWCHGVHIFRSAAGGGKTTLLRLFTPGALLALHAGRADERLKELYQRLQELGAINESGPLVLGVMLLCGRNYSLLQDLDLEQARKDRLFFGLLNARVVLAALRSALALKQLEYPKDLASLRVEAVPDLPPVPGVALPCTGQGLFRWAEEFEAKVCESLDSFGPLRPSELPGHDALHSLSLIRAGGLTIDGQPVARQVVLMMDDIHKLTARQRSLLIQTVIEQRSPVGVWIAERYEALDTQDMLASGAEEGRDYEKPVELERYWRRRHDRFEKLVLRVADRRARDAAETPFEAFRPVLQESLDTAEWEPVFARACGEIAARVRERAGNAERFREWITTREQIDGTPRERATAWRALEILIERELRRPQKGLFDDSTPLDEEELETKDDSSVQQAAELFLAREYKLPYYFGPERVSRLASLNIQQFLGLAGDVFEEAAGAALLRKPYFLSPSRQHELMKTAARAWWDEIPRRVRHGRELRNFLEAVGRFSAWYTYTYRPTAPNDPGVGGTAILMSERADLMDPGLLRKRPELRRFADILASALAHNILIEDLDYPCKKKKWMVLNLNRLLCVHFDLPLGYGKYKERPLAVLCQWLDQPFTAPARQEALL
jgi:hypothetical protein